MNKFQTNASRFFSILYIHAYVYIYVCTQSFKNRWPIKQNYNFERNEIVELAYYKMCFNLYTIINCNDLNANISSNV